jgi:hypothetical protein
MQCLMNKYTSIYINAGLDGHGLVHEKDDEDLVTDFLIPNHDNAETYDMLFQGEVQHVVSR